MAEEKKEEVGVKEAADTAKKALDNMEQDSIDVLEAMGEDYAKVKASVTKKEYYIVPCSLKKIPAFVKQVKRFEQAMQDGNGKTELELLGGEDNTLLDAMAEVIVMSLHKKHNMDKDQVMEEFGMSDFPLIFQEALNLNDFLAGMRGIKAK